MVNVLQAIFHVIIYPLITFLLCQNNHNHQTLQHSLTTKSPPMQTSSNMHATTLSPP